MPMDILPILASLRRHKVTAILLILEIALTCAIVCNAVFLIGLRLDRIHTPSGVADNELIMVRMSNIGGRSDVRARTLEDLAALRGIPGVRSAAILAQTPFGYSGTTSSIKLSSDQKLPTISYVSTYFGEGVVNAFGLELVQGRDFSADEYHWLQDLNLGLPGSSPRSVIVTEAVAKRLFPDGNALGKDVYIYDEPSRVIGIVRHLVTSQEWVPGQEDYSMILPMRVSPDAGMGGTYVMRTSPDQRDRVLDAAVAKLKGLDPRRVLTQKSTLEKQRATFFSADRATAGWLIATCAALLVVTALGIVGLGSFWVAQRRRQIGVRRALGARRVDILRYFQTENFLLATFGIVLGMGMAYGISLFLVLQYELPRLPAHYLPMGAVLLWLLGQGAVLSPALRAASVPPVVATRG
ncbi:MAG: Macrolide export ATP-binding/permease protein MacB [Luteibacter sp.]|nr:MAG: Macrolide export ATP-binding/permease protein MacB [Luteibacter sp.]